MNDNTLKSIKNIKIGDNLFKGGKVISTFKIYIKDKKVQMDDYNGTIVTGSHIVYENKKPIRVANSKKSKKVVYNEDYIYCINTENHILIDQFNNIFSDFHESDDAKSNFKANYEMGKALNNISPIFIFLINLYLLSFILIGVLYESPH